MSAESLLTKVRFEPDNELIVSEVPSGKSLIMKLSEDPSPLELMLIALGACAAIDAYKSLVIRGGEVKSVEMSLDCKHIKGENACVDEILMTYRIEAGKVGRRGVEEAVRLSLERYCSVGNSLRRKVEIKSPVVKLKRIRKGKGLRHH